MVWKFTIEEVIAVQNRANDLWNASAKPEDHDEYVAAANRLLGALEMFWSVGGRRINAKRKNKK